MSRRLSTKTIHIRDEWQPKNGEPRQFPTYQNTTFKYETSEQIGRLFDLEESGYFYTRLANPTNDAAASRVCESEGDVGTMLTFSEQAANLFTIINPCPAGDRVASSVTLYGGTPNLFAAILKRFGIDFTLVDPDAPEEELEKAFQPNAKAVFGETIADPALVVLDIERFAGLAHKHRVPLILDNTFATPINRRPFEWGADIVIHSTTKYMDDHALTVGGCIMDNSNPDWEVHKEKLPGLTTPGDSYHGITYTQKFGEVAYITRAIAQLMRGLGSIQAPGSIFLLSTGLEVLHLRMPCHCENVLKMAQYLQFRDDMTRVNYPDPGGDKYYELAKKYIPNRTCGVISFCLKGGREEVTVSMDKLKLASIATHVTDAKTCVLHPASHTHRQLNDAQPKEAGVDPVMIRLSVGTKNMDDIIANLEQALN